MFFQRILEVIFPPVCGICGKRLKNTSATCLNCLSILQYYREKIIKRNQDGDVIMALFPYEGIIRERVLQFKFQQQKYIKYSFAQLLANTIQKRALSFDVIIPVPISGKRMRERGFNQSLEIAKELAKILHQRVESRVLIKVKHNQRQSDLDRKDRKKNVKGVYQVRSSQSISRKSGFAHR